MTWLNSSERYGRISMALHWMIVLLFVAVYASIELRELFPKGSDPREAMKTWHFMLGLSVLVLIWPRLLFMYHGRFPIIQPEPPRWQQLLGRTMHITLYGLMIVMPVLGWLLLSAKAKPIVFFGLQLPALIGESKTLAESIAEFHETIGNLGYFLIGLHSAAALFHHYRLRDNTLRRMLPQRFDTNGDLNN
ncbi:cytochrome b [Methylomonas sp. 2BW1-5-20]|uniref:cytochrome b n=1 Tax=Methylomonas sp. 2BW1-5-20 TaxID=3376686 RepID=UPI004052D042